VPAAESASAPTAAPRDTPRGLARFIPTLFWLPRASPSQVATDALAGLVTAAVLAPQAMAYATIAGAPVEVGLYVSTLPMIVYALFGTSRVLSVSTTSSLALLTAAAVAGGGAATGHDHGRAIATLASVVGAVLFVGGWLRLGFLADLISTPVLAGFKLGMGILIATTQLGPLLGIDAGGARFADRIATALAHLGAVHGPTLGLGVACLAGLLVLARVAPRVPAPLVVIAGAVLAMTSLGLEARGVAAVPAIPKGLPTPALPDPALALALLPSALGVALMTLVESTAAARAFEAPDDPPLDPDQELRALGLAGLAAGLLQAMPAGGGLSQTAVNHADGARTPIAAIVTGTVVLALVLALAPLVRHVPGAALAAVVLVSIFGLFDLHAIRRIRFVRVRDGLLAILTTAAVLVLGVLPGVLVAVLGSFVALMAGAQQLPVRVLGRKRGTVDFRDFASHPGDEQVPGLLVLRPEGSLFFGNVRRVQRLVLDATAHASRPVHVVVLDTSAVPDVEVTALDLFAELDRALAGRGISLRVCALTTRPKEMIRRAGLAPEFEGRLFRTLQEAVEAVEREAQGASGGPSSG